MKFTFQIPSPNKISSIEKEYSKIHGLQVLNDNIIWIWVIGNKAVVVDPAISKPVHYWLRDRNLDLIAVLQTHHHDDHIGGTKDLIKIWPKASIIASKLDIERIPFQTISVSDEDNISLMGFEIKVMDVSAHTKNHIAYYLPRQIGYEFTPTLFCGDTLFGAGCGRIFEGTAQDMFKALQKFCKLPTETKVYCAHEYTESNLKWANHLEPDNIEIKKRLKNVIKKRKLNLLSLPSTLEDEKATNLFMMASSANELERLRLHKDKWKQ